MTKPRITKATKPTRRTPEPQHPAQTQPNRLPDHASLLPSAVAARNTEAAEDAFLAGITFGTSR